MTTEQHAALGAIMFYRFVRFRDWKGFKVREAVAILNARNQPAERIDYTEAHVMGYIKQLIKLGVNVHNTGSLFYVLD